MEHPGSSENCVVSVRYYWLCGSSSYSSEVSLLAEAIIPDCNQSLIRFPCEDEYFHLFYSRAAGNNSRHDIAMKLLKLHFCCVDPFSFLLSFWSFSPMLVLEETMGFIAMTSRCKRRTSGRRHPNRWSCIADNSRRGFSWGPQGANVDPKLKL